MEITDFRTISASVRPARIAVLVDQADSNWQELCRRLIEFLSGLWGGQHSLIVPTDGENISPLFWELLEAFDADYICCYYKTGRDIQISAPDEFVSMVDRAIKENYAEEEASAGMRKGVEDAIASSQFRWGISLGLEKALKARLAPFFFEDHVISAGQSIVADALPIYPYTALTTILPHIDHPKTTTMLECADPSIPALWIEAMTGAVRGQLGERLRSLGVEVERISYSLDDLGELFELLLEGRIRPLRRAFRSSSTEGSTEQPNYMSRTPFWFSMLALGRYRSTKERYWVSPVIVVFGSTIDDFALYFDLCRIRDHVYWLPAEWVESCSASATPAERASLPATHLVHRILAAADNNARRNIEFVSATSTRADVEAAIDRISTAVFAPGNFKRRAAAREGVGDLLKYPHSIFNANNFAVPTTQLAIEGKFAGFFPTPKPKGFENIVPYDHRWITELSIEAHAYPRHPMLGEWLIRHRLLGTTEARSGLYGLSYSCPNTAYFGGDVDMILIRPQIYVPGAGEVFELIARSKNWGLKTSGQGLFSRETLEKLGGLEYSAALLRNHRYKAVLDEYLKEAEWKLEDSVFLSSDSRRYLRLASIIRLVGKEKEAIELLDRLVGSKILHRGLVLKCSHCSSTDWFAPSEFSDQFRCKRCRRIQSILSKQALQEPEPPWFYQLDEITYQGIRNNMHVAVLALDYLRKGTTSFLYTDEVELHRIGEDRPFIEIDLSCIRDGILTIGEAKTTARIEGGGKRERRALHKYREAAVGLGVQCFVLATSEQWAPETVRNAVTVFDGTGIEVLMLDGSQIGTA